MWMAAGSVSSRREGMMKNPTYTTVRRERLSREFFRNEDFAVRQGILKLLAIKDSDIRLLTLEQSGDAVDKGLHAGGAFSSIIPLVALFYGGFIHLDIEDPTRRGQDIFTLSKGHAVATLTSIYGVCAIFESRCIHSGAPEEAASRSRLRRDDAEELAPARSTHRSSPLCAYSRSPSRRRALRAVAYPNRARVDATGGAS